MLSFAHIYNFVSYDYNWTFSHTAAILDSKMVSIIAFKKKQIYVNKIGQTYIVTGYIVTRYFCVDPKDK